MDFTITSKHIIVLLLLLIFPFTPAFCISTDQSVTDDLYHIDSIEAIAYSDPDLALERVDSLRRRCEQTAWQECSKAHLEAIAGDIFKTQQQYSDEVRCAFESLNSVSGDVSDDLKWHLRSLSLISYHYVRSQNWIMAAKYIREMEQLAEHTEYEAVYHAQSCLYRALIAMMQYDSKQAFKLLDTIPVIMASDKSENAESNGYEIRCRTQQYRANVYGFCGDYDSCYLNQMLLIDMLMSSDSVLISPDIRN